MRNNFKIHCIVLCKNEVDIIDICLREAVKWADYIYVYDNGSTDGTWDLVKNLNHPRIIPWKQEAKVFNEGLRAEVFNAFRHQSEKGDWWLRLDVDEFYIGNPREYFSRLPKGQDFVWGIMVEYVLTKKDFLEIDLSLSFDKIMPLLHHYYVAWSEPRAFRYRNGLTWKEDWAWPQHAGVVAEERIVYKHYPYRSPQQWQTRWKVRQENLNLGLGGWRKDTEDWRQTKKNNEEFLFDDGISPLKIDDSKLPRHLEKSHVRFLKQILHRSGVWP